MCNLCTKIVENCQYVYRRELKSMRSLLLFMFVTAFLLSSCVEEKIEDNEHPILKEGSFQLPRYVPVSNGKYVTSTAVMDRNKITIIYYESEKKLAVNDPSIMEEGQSIVRLRIKKFPTEEEAYEQVAFENYEEYGGQEVDLGFNITGFQETAALSFWTSWNNDYWAITTQTDVSNPDKGLALAQEVVNYLQTATLPTPHTHGRIILDVFSGNSRVVWQNGKEVYTLDEVALPMELLKIASSIQKY